MDPNNIYHRDTLFIPSLHISISSQSIFDHYMARSYRHGLGDFFQGVTSGGRDGGWGVDPIESYNH
jgi:hypothetical protein